MKAEEYKNIILRVDLTRKNFEREEIDRSKIIKFLGGRGLGAKILFDELEPSTDPLSPANKLIFHAGPMIGTGAPFCPKFCVETKSPLTGTILMSLAGGFFGARLRYSPVMMGSSLRDERMSRFISGLTMGKWSSATPLIFWGNLPMLVRR